MNKKLISIIAAAALALGLAAVLFCALVPCVGGLTPFQSAGVKRFYKIDPFHSAAKGETPALPVTAAVGANGYDRNTFIGSRIQMENEPDYIELSLAVSDDGTLVLADSYFDIAEKPITALRVAASLLESTRRTSLVADLAEYTDLNAVAALLTGSSRFDNAVVRGVDENTVSYARGYFPSHTLLCEYSHRNKLSLNEIKARGADGICCPASMLSKRFAQKVHDAGLLLWVDCGGSTRRVIKALTMAQQVDGLITQKPGLALTMQRSWSYEEFSRDYKGKNY